MRLPVQVTSLDYYMTYPSDCKYVFKYLVTYLGKLSQSVKLFF